MTEVVTVLFTIMRIEDGSEPQSTSTSHLIFAYYVTGHGFGHATRVVEEDSTGGSISMLSGSIIGRRRMKRTNKSIKQRPRQQHSAQICRVCGDEVGIGADGEPFVACNECAFQLCKGCYEYERNEGTQLCPQCKTRLKRLKGCARVEGDEDENGIDDLEHEFSFSKDRAAADAAHNGYHHSAYDYDLSPQDSYRQPQLHSGMGANICYNHYQHLLRLLAQK
ncbi:hypothetical protein ACFE04_024307 [Oxalis oulophora]